MAGIPTDPGEFPLFDVDGPERRSDDEHPESAYRRGFQQGAYEVTSKLIKAGLLDAKTVSVFNREVYDWRFGKRKLSMRSNLASPALVPPPAVARPCGKSAERQPREAAVLQSCSADAVDRLRHLSKVQSVGQRMCLGMRCRLPPTADVPSHTSGAAMCQQAIWNRIDK